MSGHLGLFVLKSLANGEQFQTILDHMQHYGVEVLPGMVEKYNNHRSIKLKPTDARKPANYNHIHNALYAKVNSTPPKFHVGDKVRIPNWTAEVFTITTVKATKPRTYTIEDNRDACSGKPFTNRSCRRVCRKSIVSTECSSGRTTECLSSGKVTGSTFNSWIRLVYVEQLWTPINSMSGSPVTTTAAVKTVLAFLEMCEDLLLETVDVGRQQSSLTSCYSPIGLDYNHLYVRGKSLHQQEYKVSRKGFDEVLSKQQISNVFANQEALHAANVSPLTSIDTLSGARSGQIQADFCDDCQDIPRSVCTGPHANEPAAVGQLLPRKAE